MFSLFATFWILEHEEKSIIISIETLYLFLSHISEDSLMVDAGGIITIIENPEPCSYQFHFLLKLFEMHALPHQLITGKDGNVDSETVQSLKSLSGTDIKIKRNLDGNTFIGYDGLDPNHWVCSLNILFRKAAF